MSLLCWNLLKFKRIPQTPQIRLFSAATHAKRNKVIFEEPLEDFNFDSAAFSQYAMDLTTGDFGEKKDLLMQENEMRL